MGRRSMEMEGCKDENSNRNREQQEEQWLELFVVQKCWFDATSPPTAQKNITEPPVDCLRLFERRSDAERVAHESAHLFASSAAHNSSNGNGEGNANVRTILLPSASTSGSISSSSPHQQRASYGFVSAGKLFWVRSLRATVVPITGWLTTNTTGLFYAHAILTDNVIGGTATGNKVGNSSSSSRGTEVAQGRVFVSLNDAAARNAAIAARAGLRQEHSSSVYAWDTQQKTPAELHTVLSLPIGVSDPMAGAGGATDQTRAAQQQLLKDWPCDGNAWAAFDNHSSSSSKNNSNADAFASSDISGSGMKRRESEQCFEQQDQDSMDLYHHSHHRQESSPQPPSKKRIQSSTPVLINFVSNDKTSTSSLCSSIDNDDDMMVMDDETSDNATISSHDDEIQYTFVT